MSGTFGRGSCIVDLTFELSLLLSEEFDCSFVTKVTFVFKGLKIIEEIYCVHLRLPITRLFHLEHAAPLVRDPRRPNVVLRGRFDLLEKSFGLWTNVCGI